MNTITNNAVRSLSFAVAAFLLLAVAFAIAPKAQAADYFDDFIAPDFIDIPFNDSPSMITPDYISYPGQDYITPDYISYPGDYYTPSYGGGGGSGFFSGGWTPSFYTGGGSYGGYSTPSNTNVNTNVNTNTNTCTNGSCNTAINAPTNIVTNYPPSQNVIYSQPPVYQPPVYIPQTPACYTCGCAGYPSCARPIAYQNQPYVTLSAVPYTGLELGPVGTALYWGFLVLWCLIAAYLIAVKKIQNNIAAWFTGSTPSHVAHAHTHAPAHHVARAAHAAPAHKPQHSGIDPFIQSQINRTK